MMKVLKILTLFSGIVIGMAAGESAAQSPALAEMAIGRDDAPLTIIEYASMTCPHCANFHKSVLPGLKSEYIDTGKVRLIYRDFPLDGLALRAAMAARCGGAERYFGFVDVIYMQQDTWSRANDPLKALEQLVRLGGLGADAFKACLENKQVQDYVLQNRLDGQNQFKVDGTPTFVIDGKTYTGIGSLDQMKKVIDPLLARKR